MNTMASSAAVFRTMATSKASLPPSHDVALSSSSSSSSHDETSTTNGSNGHIHSNKSTKKSSNEKKHTSTLSIALSWIRFLCMDVPLLLVLILYASVNWFDYVHRTYIVKQAEAFYWSSERIEQEHTYYNRYCDADDLSTNTAADLFVSPSATPQDAAAIQLKHGFTFIENVLTPQTMKELRDHIHYKNHNDKQLFVISKAHRFNILLGTEEPSVREALIEMANHEKFRKSIEAMLGPNPALVELTAITSSAGAEAQYWHQDVNEVSSATNYMQSFGPVYSVFVQLQNTTRAMGATSICPGSHYCTQGPIGAYCEEAGMQAIHPNSGSTSGDALIMNMNSYHRGSAHTDTNAPDRVMFILSFTPKPAQRAERRQLSSGFTYQLRWDMWGHTLNDMATAHTSMRQPWATLRSLGLYKPRSADWGIDYIMQSTHRIVHRSNGFAKYNLDEFIREGGFPFIPSFLEPTLSEGESWFQYLTDMFNNVIKFTEKVAIVGLASYLVLALLLWMISKTEQKLFRRLTKRFASILGLVGTLIFISKYFVDESDWAKDINLKQKFTSTVTYDQMILDQNQNGLLSFPEALSRTTLPNRRDVLIETRFGSWDLGPYNHFVDGHTGNVKFRTLIDAYRPTFNQYTPENQEAIAHFIRETVESTEQNGRFLYQFPNGMWGRLIESEAEWYISIQLWLTSHPSVKKAMELIRYGVKDVLYGMDRDKALVKYHISYLMKDIEEKILRSAKFGSARQRNTKSYVVSKRIRRRMTANNWRLHTPSVRSVEQKQRGSLHNLPKQEPYEPIPDAWIEQGDIVEAFIQGFWYGGEVLRVTADGYYHFVFIDGDSQKVTYDLVRRIRPIQPREKLEVYFNDGSYEECEVLEEMSDGTTKVKRINNNEIVRNVSPAMWRRRSGKIKVVPDTSSPIYSTTADADINDLVEVLFEDDQWFTGTITDIKVVDESNEYVVEFIDGSVLDVTADEMRMMNEYEIGETILVYIGDAYYEYELLSMSPDGTYRARDIEDDEIVEGITPSYIGRKI